MGQRRGVLCLFVALVAVGACHGAATDAGSSVHLRDNAITVGSFDFAESELLAEIYSQAMEAKGFHVKRAFDLGPREFVAPALDAGLVEFVPEYAGTALQFATLGSRKSDAQIHTTHDALAHALSSEDITVLDSAPAQDANAFVVTSRRSRSGTTSIASATCRAVASRLDPRRTARVPNVVRCASSASSRSTA